MTGDNTTKRSGSRVKRILKWCFVVVFVCVLACLGLFLYWFLRPNTAVIDPALDMETWIAVGDGMHNSNTHLVHWQGRFHLVHATSPWHFASEDCRIVLHRSADARTWEQVATFNVPEQDIRDPKLAVIGDRLCLYVLKNVALNPEPYTTAVSTSADGVEWTALEDMDPEGWLFWIPKSRDGMTWYVPAYWWEHGKSMLLKSTDGKTWTMVSDIYEGDRNDETAIEFLPDGRMLCTARLEVSDSIFGDKDAATLIAVSEPPYTDWSTTKSHVTRLDGPALFSHEGAVYAVGRHNPQKPRPLRWLGSCLGKKRTALYQVTEDRLIHLSDLPSCGDTSYAGVALEGGNAYISYYTNDVTKDYPWILGMLSASDVRMVRLPLDRLSGKPE